MNGKNSGVMSCKFNGMLAFIAGCIYVQKMNICYTALRKKNKN